MHVGIDRRAHRPPGGPDQRGHREDRPEAAAPGAGPRDRARRPRDGRARRARPAGRPRPHPAVARAGRGPVRVHGRGQARDGQALRRLPRRPAAADRRARDRHVRRHRRPGRAAPAGGRPDDEGRHRRDHHRWDDQPVGRVAQGPRGARPRRRRPGPPGAAAHRRPGQPGHHRRRPAGRAGRPGRRRRDRHDHHRLRHRLRRDAADRHGRCGAGRRLVRRDGRRRPADLRRGVHRPRPARGPEPLGRGPARRAGPDAARAQRLPERRVGRRGADPARRRLRGAAAAARVRAARAAARRARSDEAGGRRGAPRRGGGHRRAARGDPPVAGEPGLRRRGRDRRARTRR